jgi:hypothetical protein
MLHHHAPDRCSHLRTVRIPMPGHVEVGECIEALALLQQGRHGARHVRQVSPPARLGAPFLLKHQSARPLPIIGIDSSPFKYYIYQRVNNVL